MDWLEAIKNHGKLSLTLLWVLTMVGAAVGGRLTAPKPQPAVQLVQHDDYEGTRNNDVQIQQIQGPVVVKEHTVVKTVPVPGSNVTCQIITTTDREEDHGQVVVNTSDTSVVHEQEHVSTSLTITPAPDKPGWSLGVLVQNPVTDRDIRLEVGRRLFGNLWLQAGAVPVRSEWDIGLTYQW